jgi:hypothetical protein
MNDVVVSYSSKAAGFLVAFLFISPICFGIAVLVSWIPFVNIFVSIPLFIVAAALPFVMLHPAARKQYSGFCPFCHTPFKYSGFNQFFTCNGCQKRLIMNPGEELKAV